MSVELIVDNDNNELDAIVAQHDADLGLRMFVALYVFLGRFVAYPSDHARVAHALWIVHTHMMDKWDTTPRIAFLSAEPASGKTRALEVTELLVPSPVSAVNVTPAYLFRKVGSETGATILFDEIDTVFGPKAKENEEIRGLLNAGYRRGAVAGRCVVHGKTVMTEEISAYAPVALAGLGWLPDTILTRSVLVRMRRRHSNEKVEPFRRRIHEAQGTAIRSLIEQWAPGAEINWPNLPAGIEDRDADIWESLIAIADAIGGEWPDRARKAAVSLVLESKDREPSLGIRLLTDLRIVFGDREAMSSKSILSALQGLEESPWSDIKGKPLNERGLAHRLKQYGIKSKTVRPTGSTGTAMGYHRDDLHDAWNRYLPLTPATSNTSNTDNTTQENQGSDVLEVLDSPQFVLDESPSQTNDVLSVLPVLDVAGEGDDLSIPASLKRCAHDLEPHKDGNQLVHLHPMCPVLEGQPRMTTWI